MLDVIASQSLALEWMAENAFWHSNNAIHNILLPELVNKWKIKLNALKSNNTHIRIQTTMWTLCKIFYRLYVVLLYWTDQYTSMVNTNAIYMIQWFHCAIIRWLFYFYFYFDARGAVCSDRWQCAALSYSGAQWVCLYMYYLCCRCSWLDCLQAVVCWCWCWFHSDAFHFITFSYQIDSISECTFYVCVSIMRLSRAYISSYQ